MVRLLGLLVALLGSTSGDDVPPCAVDPWVRPGRSREPTQVSRDFAPYVAPTPAAAPAGSPFFERGKASVVFVHLSKSAGTTVKAALARAAAALRLRPPYTLFRRSWPEFAAACERGGEACERDLYAGTNAFGACELIVARGAKAGRPRRCAYATVLRDPVARLVSSWRYFCVAGAEKRKGWQPGWARAGGCPWTLTDWARLMPAAATLELSTRQAPRAKLAPANQTAGCPRLADGPESERSPPQSPRARAHLAAALANVVGPRAAVRAVTVADLGRGLAALAGELGLPLDPAFGATVENANDGAAAALDPALAAELRRLMPLDAALYDAVVAYRATPS